ncbi:DUF6089 family protein [Aurantibacillus circumpalustris]|uniref:type IX secretion system protein PorG n=1 Tax=Aurantibacillus circumpalustris TaxID=3036359 RepID=UPI00295A7F21|nr:DUF6089 family protein [Aurantibacillus circumpalustris]
MLKRGLLYLFCFLFVSGISQIKKRTFAQRELGFFGGGSYYIGDINPRGHFKASHPALGIFFRYAKSYRYAFRFGFNYGQISGNDATSSEPDQIERNLNFKSQLYELNATAEFNFVEYRIGHDRYKFTMFVFAGVAGFYFNSQANINGTEVSLRDNLTEGKAYPKFQLSIPFGVGLKWNIGEKCGLGIEWGPRRTFTDNLDDIKGSYPNSIATEGGGSVTNQSLNNSATPGDMRGNPSSRDWYFYYGVTLNIKLPDPKSFCPGRGRRARTH